MELIKLDMKDYRLMLEVNYFNLYLIRHGETNVNAGGEQLGQLGEEPLSELGYKQAGKLYHRLQNEKLTFDKVYASDYRRAFDTAEIATAKPFDPISNSKIDITKVEALREYSAGDWTGSKRSETLTPDILFKMNLHNMQFMPPNGESLNQVSHRVSRWLEDEILYNHDLYGKNIGVFSHGMTIKCLLHHIMGFDKGFTWRISIDNTSITHLSFGDRGWMLHSLNDTSHLK
jgi:broad specificity phosphatase PhoE